MYNIVIHREGMIFYSCRRTYLDCGCARGVVHEGKFSEGVAGLERAEGFIVVLPRDEHLVSCDMRYDEANASGSGWQRLVGKSSRNRRGVVRILRCCSSDSPSPRPEPIGF